MPRASGYYDRQAGGRAGGRAGWLAGWLSISVSFFQILLILRHVLGCVKFGYHFFHMDPQLLLRSTSILDIYINVQ